MASDSSSSTPMVLTPESTGSDTLSVKKKRRQTAFYPNTISSKKPQNPFSRSAAKRESVMALGSIEHLQHYFTKTGIAAKGSRLDKRRKGLVPAIGGLSHVHASPSLGGITEFELPPSPTVPMTIRPAYPQFVKTYETNPDTLLPGVVEDLTIVSHAWGVSQSPDGHNPAFLSAPSNSSTATNFDVLNNLKSTTRAIRSIRNYVLSLPDESVDTLRVPTNFRPSTLPSSAPVPKRVAPQPSASSDPLSLIRRAALEVLTVLRELEEKSRLPLSDDAYDVQSDHGSSPGRVASPSDISDRDPSPNPDMSLDHIHEVDPDTSIAFSVVQVEGRSESIMVWENEEGTFDINELTEEEREKRGRWDERLVLGSGWLYKQDIRLDELEQETAVVKRYLDAVDEVLFGGTKDGKRGWEREWQRVAKKEREKDKARRASANDFDGSMLEPRSRGLGRRVVSTGLLETVKGFSLTEEPDEMEAVSEDNSVDDDELPDWAKRTSFSDDFGRAHAVISNFLPPHLSSALPSSSDRKAFLQGLSSGQLLCVAYNACVRKSSKPWGYVSRDAIHDILALEQSQAAVESDQKEKDEKTRKSWTFRRTDNLRLWAGALKLRYLLPIIPSNPIPAVGAQSPAGETPAVSPSISSGRFSANEPPIIFDSTLVAKKEEGWEVMLERLLLRWVEVIVEEQRGER